MEQLPNDCINASSVNMFKHIIDRYLIRAGYTSPPTHVTTPPYVMAVTKWRGEQSLAETFHVTIPNISSLIQLDHQFKMNG